MSGNKGIRLLKLLILFSGILEFPLQGCASLPNSGNGYYSNTANISVPLPKSLAETVVFETLKRTSSSQVFDIQYVKKGSNTQISVTGPDSETAHHEAEQIKNLSEHLGNEMVHLILRSSDEYSGDETLSWKESDIGSSDLRRMIQELSQTHTKTFKYGGVFDPDTGFINRTTQSITFNTNPKMDFDAVREIALAALTSEYQHLFKKKTRSLIFPTPPSPPSELNQNPYESTIHFQSRVLRTQDQFLQRVKNYNQSVQDYNTRLGEARMEAERQVESEKAVAVKRIFLLVFGSPKIVQTSYNPDTRLFGIVVKGDGPGVVNTIFALTLANPVPNSQAPEIDRELKKATPVLHLKFKKENLVLEGGSVSLAGSEYAVLPSNLASYNLASVNFHRLSSGTPILLASEIPPSSLKISSLMISINPVLIKEEKELEKLQEERATQEQILAEKKKIEDLKRQLENGLDIGLINSPVDHPSFKLPKHQKWYAVVVGVEQYPNGLPPAEFSDHDARAVKANLIALGYPESHIRLLTDDQATNSRIKVTLKNWLSRNVPEEGRVLFYFAGHGGTDVTSKTAYLVPFDGDPDDLSDTALSVNEVERDLSQLPLSQGIIVADACFSGAGGRSIRPEGARPLYTIHRNIYQMPYKNLTVFGAARGNQISGDLPKQGHGIFTYYFLRGLEGKAKTGKTVTTRSLKRYLAHTVPRAFRHHYNSGQQNPVVTGNMNGILVKY